MALRGERDFCHSWRCRTAPAVQWCILPTPPQRSPNGWPTASQRPSCVPPTFVRRLEAGWRLSYRGMDNPPSADSVDTVIDAANYRATLIRVDISFDPAKRAITLEKRGLDFADAGLVFAAEVFTRPDDRKDYGEDRFTTAGYLAERCVVLAWTSRGGSRRIISMRYAHAHEERLWRDAAGL